MRDLSQCDAREALMELSSLLSRSLLLDASEPVACALWDLLAAVNVGDPLLACRRYHVLTGLLLRHDARRVSGDLWKDYILHRLLCETHVFSRAAAALRPEAMFPTLREELSVLGRLCALRSADIARMVEARHTEARLKNRQARDDIELFSTAVWSGGSGRALPAPEEQAPAAAPYTGELHFADWRYGEAGLADTYVSDTALEEIYARLLRSTDWSAYADDLRCFFGAYGCGALLKSRVLRFRANTLAALPESLLKPLDAPIFFEAAHERILEYVMRFMQDEPPRHLLLTGPSGMGKTAQALSVAEELPEVRLVLADATCDVDALCACLAEQPVKFLLLFDDAQPQALPTALHRLLPPNVMVCVTARAGMLDWAERLELPALSGEDFCALVQDTLKQRGADFDYAAMRSACMDAQLDARDKLSIGAAMRLARSIEEGIL